MTPSGNHTLAILNGTESYDRLKVALEDIITEVYNLQGRLITAKVVLVRAMKIISSDIGFQSICSMGKNAISATKV